MNDLIKMPEVYAEVCRVKGWDSEFDEKHLSYLTLLQKKYRVLLRNVLFRDIRQYKSKRDNYVKKSDAPVVREILIMATRGKGQDKYCIKWLNEKIKITDYEAISKLYIKLLDTLNRLLIIKEIDLVVYKKWEAALNTVLAGETATKICEIKKSIDKLFKNSMLFNNYIDLSSIKDEDGNSVFQDPDENEEFYVGETSPCDMAKYSRYQADYFEYISHVIEYFSDEAENKSVGLIDFAIRAMRMKNMNKSTFKASDLSMAYTEFGLNYQINKFLVNNPEICSEFENKYNIDDLLSYFPYIDIDAQRDE